VLNAGVSGLSSRKIAFLEWRAYAEHVLYDQGDSNQFFFIYYIFILFSLSLLVILPRTPKSRDTNITEAAMYRPL